MTVILILAVLVAGAIGAVVRFLTARLFANRTGFPTAVLVVNVVGSAIGGAILALAERGSVGHDIRLVLLTGLCGGLTTFSTWSVESIQLVAQRKTRTAILNVASNLVLGIVAAATAFLLLH